MFYNEPKLRVETSPVNAKPRIQEFQPTLRKFLPFPPRTAHGAWTLIRRTDGYILVGHYTTRVGRQMFDNTTRPPATCSAEGGMLAATHDN